MPLEGIKVVEFAQMVAAPATGLLLAEYGADVIKVEPPEGDGARHLRSSVATGLPDSPAFLAYNRNKRSVRLNLRDDDDRNTARALINEADVVLESSRPGVMARLGFGAEDVLARNPATIYASVSGFGWDGPDARRGGVDMIVQAESGIMSTTGPLGGEPTKVGFTIVDAATGHALCHGILAALLRRARTGHGEIVRTSLFDVALHLQTGPIAEFMLTGQQPERSGNIAALTSPAGLFRCSDGSLVISAYLPHHWASLLQELDAQHLADDPRFATSADRVVHRPALNAELEAILMTRSTAEWFDRLENAGILVGRVRDYADLVPAALQDRNGLIGWAGAEPGLRNPVVLLGAPVPPLRARADVPAEALAHDEAPPHRAGRRSEVLAELLALGERSERTGSAPVSTAAIRAWCGAIGEHNPMYLDDTVARAAGLPGAIAPPPMLQSWAAPDLLPEAHQAPSVHARVRGVFQELGYPMILATEYVQTYGTPVLPGDTISQVSWVDSVSTLKTTRLGRGHFVVIAFDFTNQHGESAGDLKVTTFYYEPEAEREAAGPERPPSPAPSEGQAMEPDAVELTTQMIVCSAIATKDFEANHHDPEVARAQGLDGILSSITTTSGLVLRYVTAQSEPSVRVRRLALRLGSPACVGQVLQLEGAVQPQEGGAVVTVIGTTSNGRHVTATVVTETPNL